MTEPSDTTPPFPGFPGFPPAEMLERMWGMMRFSPFSAAQPAGGLTPSLSMMSDMMAPLTNVEELDKRITDMRAVEQWLKLNLSMLQSAIQALEVQRATLATLRAFGAFAQQSMSQPSAAAPAPGPSPAPSGWPHMPAGGSTSSASSADAAAGTAGKDEGQDEPDTAPFDASAWWNLLQSQFNQIAQFAMTQPAVAVAAAGGGATQPQRNADAGASPPADPADEADADPDEAADEAEPAPPDSASPARRAAAKRAPAATKRAASGTSSARTTKKST